jgi:tRNA (cytidine/uridine-2'-O-)-methyltransferase
MDYISHVHLERHATFENFTQKIPGRLILLDVKATVSYINFPFTPNDTLILGRESTGVPDSVFSKCTPIRIPMCAHQRSLNVAVAAAMVLGEALRQTNLFPKT